MRILVLIAVASSIFTSCKRMCVVDNINKARKILEKEYLIDEPYDFERNDKAYSQALVYVNKAIECDSDCLDCYLFLHQIQTSLSDYNGLVVTYNKFLKFDSTNILNHFRRGESFLEINDSISASRDFKYVLWACRYAKPRDIVETNTMYHNLYFSEYYLYGIDRILQIEKELLRSPKTTNYQIGNIEDVKTFHENELKKQH